MVYKNITFVSIINLITRVLGYLRDLLIAFVFGTSSKAEFFIILLEIKEIFNVFFHSLSFEKNLINKYLQKKKSKSHLSFSSDIFYFFFIIISLITFISLSFSNLIFFSLFPGFEGRFNIDYINKTIRYVLLFNIFNFIIVYLSSLLQAEKKFYFNSIILIIPNCFFLIYFYFIIFNYEKDYLNNFFGYFLILTSIFQISIILIKEKNILKGLIINFKNFTVNIIEFFRSYLYSFLFIVSFTIYRFVEKYFLSYEEGLISMFYLSERIAHLPTAIIITAFSTVLLPEFFSKNTKTTKIKLTFFSDVIMYCFVIISYISTLFFFNSELIIDLLFGRGEFNENSVIKTSQIFKQKIFGVFFLAFHLILYVFYISKKLNKTLLFGSLIGLFIAIPFMFLMYYTKNYEYFGYNLVIFYSTQVFYLFYKLKKDYLKSIIVKINDNITYFYSYIF
ncbi:hypothetical protein OA524_02425, partial [Candidatus Pelagibacter sp.]|nr:hypothetical protein [Candidatus Pelagibacter sp.]